MPLLNQEHVRLPGPATSLMVYVYGQQRKLGPRFTSHQVILLDDSNHISVELMLLYLDSQQ